jgi:hypothetical protein
MFQPSDFPPLSAPASASSAAPSASYRDTGNDEEEDDFEMGGQANQNNSRSAAEAGRRRGGKRRAVEDEEQVGDQPVPLRPDDVDGTAAAAFVGADPSVVEQVFASIGHQMTRVEQEEYARYHSGLADMEQMRLKLERCTVADKTHNQWLFTSCPESTNGFTVIAQGFKRFMTTGPQDRVSPRAPVKYASEVMEQITGLFTNTIPPSASNAVRAMATMTDAYIVSICVNICGVGQFEENTLPAALVWESQTVTQLLDERLAILVAYTLVLLRPLQTLPGELDPIEEAWKRLNASIDPSRVRRDWVDFRTTVRNEYLEALSNAD